jgi:ABC-type transport system substrate-binding protein
VGTFTGIDPALNNTAGLFPACGTLMAYPDRPFPEGGQLQPELAESDPVVSRDGKTYTFTVRKDARFSTGARVTARAFAHALDRILDPRMQSVLGGDFRDIVGGQDVIDGKIASPSGVFAQGRTLRLELVRRSQICVPA